MNYVLVITVFLTSYVASSVPSSDNAKVAAFESKYKLSLSPAQRATLKRQLAEFEIHNTRVGANDAVLGNGYSYLTNEEFKDLKGLNKQALYAQRHPLPMADEATANAHNNRRSSSSSSPSPSPNGQTKQMIGLRTRIGAVSVRGQSGGHMQVQGPPGPPASFTWNKTSTFNTVAPVVSQGQCGSCYAFAAVGAVHSAHVIQHGQVAIERPSPQQIVDCSTANFGCDGGWAHEAYQYIKDKNGIASWSQYPYTALDGNCTMEPTPGLMGVASYTIVPWHSASALKSAIWISPVALTICGSSSYFQNYAGGVMTNATACGECSDHQVLAVGWGFVGTTAVWYIQNSWGTSWGMGGFGILKRDTTDGLKGMCYLTRYSSRPVART